MSFTTDSIRNIAVAGHVGTGKTTLVEQMLFCGGVIDKPETPDNGKTVSDYTDEEIERKISIHTSLSHLSWNDRKINILDTPGSGDFVGEVVAAFRVAESAVLVVGARQGMEIETIKQWRRLNNRNKPRMIFVNKMEMERADFQNVIDDLKGRFDLTFAPVTIPMGNAADFKGIINLIEMKAYPLPESGKKEAAADIPAEMKQAAEEARAVLVECAAEGDDELMEKFFEDGTLSDDQIRTGLMKGFRKNGIVPVFCGSSLLGSGISSLLTFISNVAPSPQGIEETIVSGEQEETRTISADGPFAAFCFKTSIDQFSGKLSFVKIMSGTIRSDSEGYNPREERKERIGKLYLAQGKKLEDTRELTAGDIGILNKLQTVHTNDSITQIDNPIRYRPLQLPQPVHALAISAAAKKDEDKLSSQIHRVSEEDLTFQVHFNPETKETVVSGMGELQINLILDRIKDSQKIDIETKVPMVAYRETVTKTAGAEYTHKKQTGGHGQYAKVVLDIKPIERGEQFKFSNAIHGGSISKGYIPAVEKGVVEGMESGILAGYPVVDVEAVVLDGKEHPVDSSEMAFKIAARGAFKDAMGKANPVLLEPVMNLNVFVEEQYLGDVLSDLSSRRGRVMGQDAMGGGIMEIKAQVPQAELLRYAIDLKSITSGTGSFEVEFDHYSPVTGKIAEDVINAAKAMQEA